MSARSLHMDRRASAGAEMALVLPLLLVLLLGSVELGNYFRSEHILLKGVRDGAVYAARQEIPVNYDCAAGTPTVPAGIVNETKTLVRTGALSGGSDLLPLWDDGSTTFTITVNCMTSAGGTAMAGLYNVNGGRVPVLTVSANLPYGSLFGALGLGSLDLRLKAAQQTAAYGI
jgi:Flp pilus assembly protein TadG